MKNSLKIIARIQVKEENVDFVKNELLKLIEPTKKEEGCLKYTLHQDINNPNIFMFYEIWENKELLEKHLKNEHLVNYMKVTEGMIEKFEITELKEI